MLANNFRWKDQKQIPPQQIPQESDSTKHISGFKRYFLYGSGIMTLAVGVIGIFLPILPTTPFLLLSAACFFKSSPKAYHWLLNNKIVGNLVKNYHEGKGLSKRHKITTITLLWVTIGGSILLISFVWLQILLFIIAIAVSIHIGRIQPRKPKG